MVAGKNTGLLEFFFVAFENVDGDQDGASGEFGRVVFQKTRVIENELTKLESHLTDNRFLIVV